MKQLLATYCTNLVITSEYTRNGSAPMAQARKAYWVPLVKPVKMYQRAVFVFTIHGPATGSSAYSNEYIEEPYTLSTDISMLPGFGPGSIFTFCGLASGPMGALG